MNKSVGEARCWGVPSIHSVSPVFSNLVLGGLLLGIWAVEVLLCFSVSGRAGEGLLAGLSLTFCPAMLARVSLQCPWASGRWKIP